MRLLVYVEDKVNGRHRPAVVVGYAPGKNGAPLAICIGLGPSLVAIPVSECFPPKLPKRLERRLRRQLKSETRDAERQALEAGLN